MSIKVTFTWSERNEEGNISRANRARILELAKADWVTTADFMQDVVHYAQELYNEVVEMLPDSDMVTQAGRQAND
jgi:hypothetical protein